MFVECSQTTFTSGFDKSCDPNFYSSSNNYADIDKLRSSWQKKI